MGNNPTLEYSYYGDEEKKGETPPIRNTCLGKDEPLVEYVQENIDTVKKGFIRSAERLTDKPFLGTRKVVSEQMGENPRTKKPEL